MRSSRALIVLIVMVLVLLTPIARSVGEQTITSAASAPATSTLKASTPEATEVTPALRFTDTVPVDGDRRIGLTCVGSGSPTVILIGGMVTPGEGVWPDTVDALQSLTRICVFDRAGIGPSDLGSSVPQTAADIVADLNAALAASGEVGPFVPVGFSFGGLIARLYASTYPDQLAGLVLVEGAPPGWNVMDLTLASFQDEAERQGFREELAGREPFAPAAPVDYLVSEAQVLAAPPPPSVPILVIVAGKAELMPSEGRATWYDLEGVARYFELQAAQVRDLGALVVVAQDSGHFVPLDQPVVVIAAIADVVALARNSGSWVSPAEATPVS